MATRVTCFYVVLFLQCAIAYTLEFMSSSSVWCILFIAGLDAVPGCLQCWAAGLWRLGHCLPLPGRHTLCHTNCLHLPYGGRSGTCLKNAICMELMLALLIVEGQFLIQRDLNDMAVIFTTAFSSDTFSATKKFEFWLEFLWSLFLH